MERIQPEHMENPVNQEERGVQSFQEREMPAEAPRGDESQRVDGFGF